MWVLTVELHLFDKPSALPLQHTRSSRPNTYEDIQKEEESVKWVETVSSGTAWTQVETVVLIRDDSSASTLRSSGCTNVAFVKKYCAKPQYRPLNRLSREHLSSLQIRCRFSAGPKVCTAVVRLSDLEQHERQCPIAPVNCRWPGCRESRNLSLTRENLAAHEESCEYNVNIEVECPQGCGTRIQQHQMHQHLEQCSNSSMHAATSSQAAMGAPACNSQVKRKRGEASLEDGVDDTAEDIQTASLNGATLGGASAATASSSPGDTGPSTNSSAPATPHVGAEPEWRCDVGGRWVPFTSALSRVLERAFATLDPGFEFFRDGFYYTVDWAAMTQTNVDSGATRALQRSQQGASPAAWACRQCTYLNQPEAALCNVCEAPCLGDEALAQGGSSAAEEGASSREALVEGQRAVEPMGAAHGTGGGLATRSSRTPQAVDAPGSFSGPAAQPSYTVSDAVPLAGMTFCCTGTLSIVRSAFEALLAEHGGHVGKAVTARTTHLVCGEEDGLGTSKHTKALQVGAQIVTEQHVRSLISGLGPSSASTVTNREDMGGSSDPSGAAEVGAGSERGREVAMAEASDVEGGTGEAAAAVEEERWTVNGSGGTVHTMKKTGSVFSCTCPAWRFQSVVLNRRTCKHLKAQFGEAHELARCGAATAAGAPARPRNAGGAQPRSVQGTGARVAPALLLANKFSGAEDISGWWVSEKLDGVRAYWDGTNFVSRQGNHFVPPPAFTDGLPRGVPLDGELWTGRGKFSDTISLVRSAGADWLAGGVEYVVFDAPSHPGPFEERLEEVRRQLEGARCARSLDQRPCDNTDDLKQELARVEGLGGEGLMLRKPGSAYVGARSSTCLKVKTMHDAEAKVVGYKQGQGRHNTRTGSLHCELPSGKKFFCGTGLSDAQRSNPPALGSIITFRYFEMTADQIPRFPVFLREREELTWDEVIANAA
ncbi:hypothetical protein CYMTET_32000 [Cymbomonas tetramitiformis]|uniref:DNA ligase n=1 Tax=Cymbomonas tetramitiformis TaxID=36881 RepID=A0AAE0FFY2_9CHLO|nr:hypothetical protein CYMTET_32000 [Cymbomonas tetramitiformis]